MNIDSRAYTKSNAISPIKLDSYFACMTALFVFVAVVAVQKNAASKVSLTSSSLSSSTDRAIAVNLKATAHGRYGAPRWLQQQKSQTLVADLND